MKNIMELTKATQSNRIIWACLILFLFFSCVSTKDIVYFQSDDPRPVVIIKQEAPYEHIVQPGDILSITVSSQDSNNDQEDFNPIPSIQTQQSQIGGFIVLQQLRGFTVDASGMIDFPKIGKWKVSGLTTKEVENYLIEHLKDYIASPVVTVYIANFIISILGEVARPAQYVITNNKITLPEALALAGDLTIFGKRKNVLLIRNLEGKRLFARIDLTDRDLFLSPYFYLHAGDYIYVEPTKGKLTSIDLNFQLAPIVISSLSFLLLIINTLTKL